MSFENELNYLNLNEEQESLNQRIVLTQDEVDDILKEYPDGSDMTSILDIDPIARICNPCPQSSSTI